MVRLLLAYAEELVGRSGFNPTMVRLLQLSSLSLAEPSVSFNPTMVRLLLLLATASHSPCFGFNPTMVRLLPGRYGKVISRLLKFQSHNGAIAAYIRRALQILVPLVSIPQWCDCCLDDMGK